MPGIERQAEVLECGRGVGCVARADSFDDDPCAARRRRERRRWILDSGLAVREVEDAASRSESRAQLAGGEWQRRDGLERREREERDGSDEDPVEITRGVRRNGRGQDGDRRRAGDDHGEPIGHSGGERIAASQARELAVDCPEPLERLLLAAVDDELGRSAQELDELRREAALRVGSSVAGGAADQPRRERHDDPSEKEPYSEQQRGERKDRGSDADGDRAGNEGDDRWAEPTQIEALERIDVADHATHEVAPAVLAQFRGSERLDPLVEAHADARKDTEREVVGGEALEVARHGPRKAEEAHRHDDGREGEDRGLLGGSRDQVSR